MLRAPQSRAMLLPPIVPHSIAGSGCLAAFRAFFSSRLIAARMSMNLPGEIYNNRREAPDLVPDVSNSTASRKPHHFLALDDRTRAALVQ